jgi:hypothetical protein
MRRIHTRQWMSCLALGLAATFPQSTFGQKKSNASKEEKLARVTILNFEDKTGAKNFGYMPDSLANAIDSSLQKRFLYERDEPKAAAARATELRKKRGSFGADESAEYCRISNTDILIFGSFSYDEQAHEIVIETSISLGTVDRFRILPPVRNRVDNTIFSAVDKVADTIVTELASIAKEQATRDGKAGETAKKGEKIKIRKEEKTVAWSENNWMIGLTGGIALPILSTQYVTPSVAKAPSVSLSATRRILKGWHAGLIASYSVLQTQVRDTTYTGELKSGDLAAIAGYYWDFKPRWRLASEIGAGYYGGYFKGLSNCNDPSGCTLSVSEFTRGVNNPLFLGRVGIHFLTLSYLSIGLTVEWRSHYDKPYPLNSIGAGLSVSGVF